MKRYIALLRGINISGKNKISMPELKRCFEEAGYIDVKTYLNSGNVIFSTENESVAEMRCQITNAIKNVFGLDIPVFLIEREKLEDLLKNAPDWWGNDDKDIYDNLIFVIPPANALAVYDELGSPKQGLEQVQDYNGAIFWSFIRKDYQKTNWWSKTASANISDKLTIRTANTVKRIVAM